MPFFKDAHGVNWQLLREAREARLARLHVRVYQACIKRLRENKEKEAKS